MIRLTIKLKTVSKILILTLVISLLGGMIGTAISSLTWMKFGGATNTAITTIKSEAGPLGLIWKGAKKLKGIAKKHPKTTKAVIYGGLIAGEYMSGGNFILGHMLEFIVGGLATTLEQVLKPPQELIYNYDAVDNGDGTFNIEFREADEYALYIFSPEMWATIRSFYYYFSGLLWTALVVIIIYYALRLALPTSGLQDTINAKDIIGTSILVGLSLFFMPYYVGILSDLSILLVALASNIPDPELIISGLLAYETGHKLLDAFFHLLALGQIGLLNLIYFLRNMTIFALIALFPVVLILYTFPSKRQLLGMWNREMLANIFLQPLHAFLYGFAFLFMQEADEVTRYVYSALLLLAVIPAGMLLRAAFGAHMVGSSLVTKALIGGTGLAGLFTAGKIFRGGTSTAKDAIGKTKEAVEKQGGLGRTLRNTFSRSAKLAGAALGYGVMGLPGAKIGGSVGSWAGEIGDSAINSAANIAKKVDDWNKGRVQASNARKTENSALQLGQLQYQYNQDKNAYAEALKNYKAGSPNANESLVSAYEQMILSKQKLGNELQSPHNRELVKNPTLSNLVNRTDTKSKEESLKLQANTARTRHSNASKGYAQTIASLPSSSKQVLNKVAHKQMKMNSARKNHELATQQYHLAPLGSKEKAEARNQMMQTKKRLAVAQKELATSRNSKALKNITFRNIDMKDYREIPIGSPKKAEARKAVAEKIRVSKNNINQAIGFRSQMMEAKKAQAEIEKSLIDAQKNLGASL